MYKIKAFIKRQPHLSYEQFVEHYENWHAPWGYPTFCVQYVRRYIRHYVKHPDNAPEFPFDVMTEFWFNSEQDFHAWCKYKDDHDLSTDLLNDELSFFDLHNAWVVPFESIEETRSCPEQRPTPGLLRGEQHV